MIRTFVIAATLLASAHAYAAGSGSVSVSGSPSSANDVAIVIQSFRADGLMTILTRYYLARGFVADGSPQVTARPDLRRCPDRDTCYDVFDVALSLSNAAGLTREVRAVVQLPRFEPMSPFLYDRYNGRTTRPIQFLGLNGDQSMPIAGGQGELLAMWINHAGFATPGADSGASRRHVMSEDPTFFVESLRCYERTTGSTCKANFVSGASYTFDALASEEIIARLQTAPVTPVPTPQGNLYETSLVDCGQYVDARPNVTACWVIAR